MNGFYICTREYILLHASARIIKEILTMVLAIVNHVSSFPAISQGWTIIKLVSQGLGVGLM